MKSTMGREVDQRLPLTINSNGRDRGFLFSPEVRGGNNSFAASLAMHKPKGESPPTTLKTREEKDRPLVGDATP